MTSARLVLAARTNGSKSRGPITPAGKRKSSANSRTHGLYSKSCQPDAACETEYHQRLAALQAEFRPETSFAQTLVTTVARALAHEHWVSRIGLTLLANELKKRETNQNFTGSQRHYQAFKRHHTALNKLALAEGRFHQSWTRALDHLQKIAKMQERTRSSSLKIRTNEPDFTTPTRSATSDTIKPPQMRSLSYALPALPISVASAQTPAQPPAPAAANPAEAGGSDATPFPA